MHTEATVKVMGKINQSNNLSGGMLCFRDVLKANLKIPPGCATNFVGHLGLEESLNPTLKLCKSA